MKKMLIVPVMVLVLSLLISGCVVDVGTVTTRTYDYTDFESVEISNAFQAEIVQSNIWSVSITAGSKLFDHLNISIEDRILKISLRSWQLWNFRQPKARITMPELYSLKLSGASTGSVSGFKSNHDTDFYVSGASKVDLDLEAYDSCAEVSGASRVTGRLSVHDMDMEVTGASRAELEGTGNSLDIYVSGASRVDMENFTMTDASVDVSGASRLTISPTGKTSVSLSGASSLHYTGNPQLESINISGSSTIHKK